MCFAFLLASNEFGFYDKVSAVLFFFFFSFTQIGLLLNCCECHAVIVPVHHILTGPRVKRR